MTRGWLFALGLTCLAPLAVMAQVNPKPGDGTADSEVLCPVVAGEIRFCGASPEFVLTPQQDNSEVTAYYTTPEDIQVAVIFEGTGSNQGLTVPALQDAALSILSGASGTPVANIPVLERTSVGVDGVPRPNFVYRGNVGGVDYVYSNTMVLLENTVAQLVTIDNGTMVISPAHRDLHMRFTALVQVNR